MIKSTLKKVFQLIFILMVAYAGSFVLMEETSEKTEKTEKSEEALHSIYHSKYFGKTIATGVEPEVSEQLRLLSNHNFSYSKYYLPADFNIHFIYHTSYLDVIGSTS